MTDIWVIWIDWGDGFWSPPIGPYDSHADAEEGAKQFRKLLKKAGRPWQGRVHVAQIVHPNYAANWALAPEPSA